MSDSQAGSNPDFKAGFIGGVSWIGGAQIASQVLTFLAGVLLARLLMPKDFGLIGMALVYTSLIRLLGQVGFSAAVIHRQDLTDNDLSTMYWASLAISVLLYGLAVAFAPAVAAFFRDARLTRVIEVSSIAFIVSAIGGVQRVLLEKQMRFRRLAANELIASGVYAFVSTAMALTGFGVWSLVVSRLAEQVVDSTFAWFTTGWSPRLEFSTASLRRSLGYGSRVWGSNVLYYGQENVDNLVVGRVLGATSLGFYSMAFRLANVPRWFLINVVFRVMFPALSSAQSDHDLLRRAYLKISSYVTLTAMGLCAGLAMVAPEFVQVVYGAKWLPAVRPLQILAVAAAVYSIGQAAGPALLSLGRPGLQLRIGFVSTTCLVVAALIGVRWGTVGVATAVLLAVTVGCVMGQTVVLGELHIKLRSYLRALAPPLVATATMVGVLWAWRFAGRGMLGMGPFMWLVSAVAIGAVVFIGTLAITGAPHVADVLGYISALRSNAPGD
jgi:O-antigen/teichoic acid export membrane protein